MSVETVCYDAENLRAFAREFVVNGDLGRAYGTVFRSRGREKNAQAGAVLGGRADVKDLIEAERRRVVAEARRGIEGEIGPVPAGMGDDLDRMIHVVAQLAFTAKSEAVRLGAAVRYEALLAAQERRRAGEDVPEELRAFLEELRNESA